MGSWENEGGFGLSRRSPKNGLSKMARAFRVWPTSVSPSTCISSISAGGRRMFEGEPLRPAFLEQRKAAVLSAIPVVTLGGCNQRKAPLSKARGSIVTRNDKATLAAKRVSGHNSSISPINSRTYNAPSTRRLSFTFGVDFARMIAGNQSLSGLPSVAASFYPAES